MATAKRLPSGNWRVQVYVGRKPDGKPDYVSVTACSKKEAELQALQVQLHHKEVSRDASAMTLAEAMDKYIAGRESVLSPSTVRGYQSVRRNNLRGLMPEQLRRLTLSKIQAAVNEEARTHAPKSVRNAYGLLTATLRAYHPALAHELDIHPPTMPQKIIREPQILEPDQVRTLMLAVQGDPIELPVLLAVWLGMRMSEILGLQWEDVDFDRSTLYIHQARVRGPDSSYVVKTTKTVSSTRTLQVPDYVLERLAAAHAEATSEFAYPKSGNSLLTRFKTVLRHAGLPPIRFHDLRHCNASVMAAIGVPEFYAQRRGGWATSNTMHRVYTHQMLAHRSTTDDAIDAYFTALADDISHDISHDAK